MLGLDHHRHAVRLERFHDRLGDLAGQAFLNLGAAGVCLDHPRQLADADDPPLGEVADVGLAVEGEQVVLAHAVEGDVAQDDHLIVRNLEAHLEVVGGVLVEALEYLGVHLGDAPGRLDQALAGGVVPDRLEHLDDGRANARLVDSGLRNNRHGHGS